MAQNALVSNKGRKGDMAQNALVNCNTWPPRLWTGLGPPNTGPYTELTGISPCCPDIDTAPRCLSFISLLLS